MCKKREFLRKPVLNEIKKSELQSCLHGECTACHVVFYLFIDR